MKNKHKTDVCVRCSVHNVIIYRPCTNKVCSELFFFYFFHLWICRLQIFQCCIYKIIWYMTWTQQCICYENPIYISLICWLLLFVSKFIFFSLVVVFEFNLVLVQYCVWLFMTPKPFIWFFFDSKKELFVCLALPFFIKEWMQQFTSIEAQETNKHNWKTMTPEFEPSTFFV